MKGLFVNSKYRDAFVNNGLADFYSIYNYYSDKYFSKNLLRNVVSFSLNGEVFFLKRHQEKYWIWPRGSSPAKKEWDNIDILDRSGFKTMEPVAYGQKVPKIGTRLSFIITKKIEGAISLEEYLRDTLKKEPYNTRQQLVKDLAEMAKRFHGMGYCHQDFYAGHIFLRQGELYLIDVQRLFQKGRLRDRWRIKDLAQLNYSVPGDIVSNAARLRFLKYYFGASNLDKRVRVFIRRIQRKTEKISRHTQKLIRRGRFNY